MSLASMFILFESILHDPTNAESKTNMFFLDMAAGFFSRLEYDSGGSLRGSLFSEFTFLAREFLHKEQELNRPASLDMEMAESALSDQVLSSSQTVSVITVRIHKVIFKNSALILKLMA
jgi:hypothetical protein